ncbi:hypothetical protein EDC04DRAFT_2617498 [Pisolithus marmoratus]|nr:hypothetical protein EDC04DRAFT_2617498 [Pisolithus marmoratus]
MYTCTTCQGIFQLRTEYASHRRQCIAEVVTFFHQASGRQITIERNQDGFFECFCSDRGCPNPQRVYKNVETLKKHMKKVGSTWTGPDSGSAGDETVAASQQATTAEEEVQNEREDSTPSTSGTLQDDGPSNGAASPEPMEGQMDTTDQQEEQGLGHHATTPIPIPEATGAMESDHALYDPKDGLIHHPYLDTLNLVVDPELKALCCQQCQVALIPREALAHMHGQHKGLHVNREHFLQVLGQLEIHEDLPEPYFGCVIPPFKGLKVLDGQACGLYSFVTSSLKYMQTHHREDHRDTAMPRTWAACKMQQFNRSGRGHVLFQVEDTASANTSEPNAQPIVLLRQEIAQASTHVLPQDEWVISPWLRTTRWHEHIAGYDVGMLLGLVEIPKHDKDELLPGLKSALARYFEEALALLPITDELVLQRLNSPDPQKSGINNTPFHCHQHQDTMANYTPPVMALIWMLAWAANEGTYDLPLPDTLRAKVAALREALQHGGDTSDRIHDILTTVWLSKWTKTTNNPLPCPTECMLALFTLDKDGKHKEPIAVTHHLAKLEYCIHLVCLNKLKHQALTTFGENDEEACDALQPSFTEHTNYPFSRIRGNSIHLNGLCSMFAASAAAVVDLWEQKVLRGIKIHISYDDLADDLGNHDVGYSFLTDRRNTCFTDCDALGNRFLTDPLVAGQFGVQRNGRMIWNMGALQGWLQDYAEFQDQLLLCCETLSGAPGHGTELTPLTFCNTREWPQRSVVILGKYVALLCCYHKSAAMTGQEKLIPHALDALTGDLLIQSLALAWPFAELAAYLCYRQQPEILQLYQSHLFVNKTCLFTTDNISHSMGKLSLQHLGVKLTVNPWQHRS